MSQELMKTIEATQLRDEVPEFNSGDTVEVHLRVTEGEKERIQKFRGTVISRRGSGVNETAVVRKISGGIGVERIFLIHSPKVADVDLIRRGHVRRSKLFYLRDRKGKSARVKEKRKQ